MRNSNCKHTISELENSFDKLSNALSLAGNNVRLKILFLLSQERELYVCDLSEILSMKIASISPSSSTAKPTVSLSTTIGL